MLTSFGWNFEIWAVQKYVLLINLVDLVKSFQTRIYLQKSASIQPRTSPSKFRGKLNSLFICLLIRDARGFGSPKAGRHWPSQAAHAAWANVPSRFLGDFDEFVWSFPSCSFKEKKIVLDVHRFPRKCWKMLQILDSLTNVVLYSG